MFGEKSFFPNIIHFNSMMFITRFLFFLFLCSFSVSVKADVTDKYLVLCCEIFDSDSFIVKKETPRMTVMAPLNQIGYVALSNSEEPFVIAYSKESCWDEQQFPPELLKWFDNYTPQSKARKPKAKNTTIWHSATSVAPLISSKWHQSSPYNDYAPYIPDGNIKTAAGCVAIAAAQITYYWRRDNPDFTLRDTPVYPYGKAPVTFSILKGTSNDWWMMKDEYTDEDSSESRDAVARLCYVLGTTSYLNYGTSTGGHITDAKNALFLQYDILSDDHLMRSETTQDDWEQLLYEEVSKGRPVMCSGQGNGGHAFILDGYDCERHLFHFNFGWGGSGDGYYPVDDSNNAMGGYAKDQGIVYNIHPKKKNINATIDMQDEGNGCIMLKVEVTNKSTLPACISLEQHDVINDNSPEITIWSTVVDNTDNTVVKTLSIEKNTLAPNTRFLIYDDCRNVLCSLNYDLSSINEVLDSHNDDFSMYDLLGRKILPSLYGKIVIRKNNHSAKKMTNSSR